MFADAQRPPRPTSRSASSSIFSECLSRSRGAPETEMDGYEAQRRPAAVDDILKQTDKNIRTLAESDRDARERNFDEWRKMAT